MIAKRVFAASTLLLTALSLVPIAQAEDPQPPSRAQRLIWFRQGTMTVMGGTFPQLGAMAAGKMPYDAKRAQLLADRMVTLAGIAAEVFPPDSKEGGKTKAKAEIWTNRAEFDKLLADLGDKTAALATAAKAGTVDALKPAAENVGKACKACHDKFQEK